MESKWVDDEMSPAKIKTSSVVYTQRKGFRKKNSDRYKYSILNPV